ncbi:hypothetical protein EDM52_18505 [Brevibacillus invocatus]|uniref:Uncharacterized protein n=1 Tax=Brevibacillus invocatus TaxID=173959 RepID=A0A3M8C2U2_9BACL|nr:hypothetical protein [Brevibacillus invocatus]RNB69961.1 hypothetical protein EDM52_18505 [Brevibacillus invocatus]
MFGNKTLQQHVNEFLSKVNEQEGKIRSKIEELEFLFDSLTDKVKVQTAAMIELEIAGDNAGAEKIMKSNRQLRLQIDEIKDSIQGYRSQLGQGYQLGKELDKVKAAAIQADKDRVERVNNLHKQGEQLAQQIADLKMKREQVMLDWRVSYSRTTEMDLVGIASYIDPRATALSLTEKETLIRKWMSGETIEDFFSKSDEYKGPIISIGDPGTSVEYRPPQHGGNSIPQV